ncbi:hypothetical protein K402DRAFT_449234 [Aulographum hederae CBS 113979]|uniref:Uncharacterized protein n=1 Tax=Aulographum hederae CBS 113979 TaxID=1176131 RepID=A0A6G1GKV4_9PEZI|nr:hypothetical protein K402DRAFT_449234 [Aulographum hederae CBS 113979]
MAASISFSDTNSGLQVGINNGRIESYLPPERPETPPNPSAIIPFSRDRDFVERGAILDQIHQKCCILGSRTALIGLGGVGKSQLAIEYAFRTRERSPETWILWVHASNAARFEQSYRDIADRVKVFGRRDPKVNIFKLVHDWLCDERRKWVLILDNVDDAGFLFGGTGQNRAEDSPLVSYLPQCQHGAILVTTRSKTTALELVEERDFILVEPMDKTDAVVLFKKKLSNQNDNGSITELVTALEYMPLAIVQAAAYISKRTPRCSVRQYLEKFRENDRKRASLLDFEGGKLRRDRDAKNSIIITWQISFDHIRKIRSSAAELLSLMSFFDRQGIPETLLRGQNEPRDARPDEEDNNAEDNVDNDDNDDSSEDDDVSTDEHEEFENDISTLRSYSFISFNANESSFEMHGLVQLATRRWLEAQGQQEKWKQHFIRNLYLELPGGQHENWATCQTLFPHAQSAARQKPEEQESLKMWATILYRAAWYAEQIGNGATAEEMSVAAMKARKKLLGREHQDTLWSMLLVGAVYNFRGQWDAAESLFVQLGVDHPSTLTSMANLASTFWNQGRWEEAESLFVQVMETRKSKLGVDHPDTLTSMNNLARTFKSKGEEGKAIKLMEDCVGRLKRILGPGHPHTKSSEDALIHWRMEDLD